jgi:hypothetical protein
MTFTFSERYKVPTANDSIQVEFTIEYETYGWTKEDKGHGYLDVVDVYPGAFKYVVDNDNKLVKQLLTDDDVDCIENWLAVTSLDFFEYHAAQDYNDKYYGKGPIV